MSSKHEIWNLADVFPYSKPLPSAVEEVKQDILYSSIFQRALPVDKETGIIISGHSRYYALVELGFRRIPVWPIDYYAEHIVVPTDTQYNPLGLSKEDVTATVERGELHDGYIQHLINEAPISYFEPNCMVPIQELQTRVLTPGVFDLFHIGHLNKLKRASAHGQFCMVGVQYNVEKYKQVNVFYSLEQRMNIIRSLRFVDLVIPYERLTDLIQDINFDILIFGPEHTRDKYPEVYDLCEQAGREIVIISRTTNISSTRLRAGLDGATELAPIEYPGSRM